MRGLRGLAGVLLALAVLAPGAVAKPGDLIVGNTEGSGGDLKRVKPNGSVSTLSNDPDLVYPTGTTFTAAGQLFAADYDALGVDQSGAIFRVNPLTGSALGFEDDALFEQPIHLDFHPNGFLYVADYQADALARVNPVTGAAVSVGDFTSPELEDPVSVVVLPSGSMVVGRSVKGPAFLRVGPTGAAAPIATSGDPIGRAYGTAVDARGRVLIADQNNNAILRMVPRTGRITRLSSGGLLIDTFQPAELPSGKIAVANGEGGIVIVNPRNGNQRYLAEPDEVPFAEGISVEPPTCFGQRANIVGTKKNDKLKGSRFPDVIAGLGGDDVIKGKGGKDRLCGNGGDDVIKGGPGRDKLRGGGGDDRVRR